MWVMEVGMHPTANAINTQWMCHKNLFQLGG
jgi:hypothetical protein